MRRLQSLARHRKGTLNDLEKETRGPAHGSMECTLKFDIFSGAIDESAFWLERVEGLENAKRRKGEIATKSPGKYFAFCDFSQTVVARTDTSSTAVRRSEVGKTEGTSDCEAPMRHETQLTPLGCSRIECCIQSSRLGTIALSGWGIDGAKFDKRLRR